MTLGFAAIQGNRTKTGTKSVYQGFRFSPDDIFIAPLGSSTSCNAGRDMFDEIKPTLKYPVLWGIPEEYMPRPQKLYRWRDYEFDRFDSYHLWKPTIDLWASYPITYISPTTQATKIFSHTRPPTVDKEILFKTGRSCEKSTFVGNRMYNSGLIPKLKTTFIDDQTEWFNRMIYRWRISSTDLQILDFLPSYPLLLEE